MRRQLERPVAHPYEAADRMPDGLEKPSDLAVSSLFQNHPVPLVGPLAGAIAAHALEPGRDPVQVDALQKLCFLVGLQRAADAGDVLAFQTISGMHQAVGKLARIREQQQPRAIEVQPAHCHPPARRQLLEYGRPALRIAARDQLTNRLVIQEHSGLRRLWSDNRFAIHQDRIPGRRAIAELGDLTV